MWIYNFLGLICRILILKVVLGFCYPDRTLRWNSLGSVGELRDQRHVGQVEQMFSILLNRIMGIRPTGEQLTGCILGTHRAPLQMDTGLLNAPYSCRVQSLEFNFKCF